MAETTLPPEAVERLMSVLLWGWLRADEPGASVETVARQAISAALDYIDAECPEWYGRRWLRAEELAAVRAALAGEAAADTVTWLDGACALEKVSRAIERR